MNALFFAIALFIVIVSAPFRAEALPVSSTDLIGSSTKVTPVAGGCGPGWHRGPYGGCRRQWRPRGGMYRCWFVRTPYGPRRVCR
ncbi:GCG_CRPN prefix-to-repeats domain-containing protein [Methylobacterium nodulans]|uniref:GCG_CRPN prefix-to-repeats domain-containing protein n=1 Tax=Methylobacterium nodulans TaxID=114616 RepID=UPI000A0475B0